jgi:hypothetical protein
MSQRLTKRTLWHYVTNARKGEFSTTFLLGYSLHPQDIFWSCYLHTTGVYSSNFCQAKLWIMAGTTRTKMTSEQSWRNVVRSFFVSRWLIYDTGCYRMLNFYLPLEVSHASLRDCVKASRIGFVGSMQAYCRDPAGTPLRPVCLPYGISITLGVSICILQGCTHLISVRLNYELWQEQPRSKWRQSSCDVML